LDNSIKLWDKNNGELLTTLIGHGDWVWSVAFDTGNMLASGSGDSTIKIWGK
jgi:WD40 repeat protein